MGNRAVGQLIQRKKAAGLTNKTGLPDNLKAGLENLSGLSMADVKVHYNSPEPKQLQALAYTKGTDIHLAPGQEKHLPHEAWHVVQQKQGRVAPTMQLKDEQLNDDSALECEADVMGLKALQARPEPADIRHNSPVQRNVASQGNDVIQAKWKRADNNGGVLKWDGCLWIVSFLLLTKVKRHISLQITTDFE